MTAGSTDMTLLHTNRGRLLIRGERSAEGFRSGAAPNRMLRCACSTHVEQPVVGRAVRSSLEPDLHLHGPAARAGSREPDGIAGGVRERHRARAVRGPG